MSGFLASETKSFLHAFFTFLSGKFSNFDDVYIHGVRVLSLGGSGEGMIGLVSGFGVSFGDLFGMLPLGLEGDSIFIPIANGRGNHVHRHDSAHEGGRDAGREVSNEDILVSDVCERGVVLEVRNVVKMLSQLKRARRGYPTRPRPRSDGERVSSPQKGL